MDSKLSILVECYAGYRGEETPCRFQLKSRTVEIINIVDRWLAPEHRYFKVIGDDGGIYILRHDSGEEKWELTMFDSGRSDQVTTDFDHNTGYRI